jgi:hypothetical protein
MQALCPPGYPFGMVARNLAWPAGIIALAVAAVVGYMAYGAAQKRAQQREVTQLVRDSTERLRQALGPNASPELVSTLDTNLRSVKAPRDPALADAAEQYITGAREIARRRVAVAELERKAAASRAALAGHMAHASRRNDAWLRDAVALKKQVESQHYELNLTLKALDELLFTLPESEKPLAPRVGTDALLETGFADSARKQVQAETQRAAEELGRVRNIVP